MWNQIADFAKHQSMLTAITKQARQQRTPPERLAQDGLWSHFATSNPTPEEILEVAA